MQRYRSSRIFANVVISMACMSAVSGPVVVQPGSNAGYLYLPPALAPSTSSSSGLKTVTNIMEIAPTICFTNNLNTTQIPIPASYTSGTIQAIVVGGGGGGANGFFDATKGGDTTLTYGAMVVVARGGFPGNRDGTGGNGGSGGGGGSGGDTGAGGGGGYGGVGGSQGHLENAGTGGTAGGNGGPGVHWFHGGPQLGGIGQGSGYGGSEALGGLAAPGPSGSVGLNIKSPAFIPCRQDLNVVGGTISHLAHRDVVAGKGWGYGGRGQDANGGGGSGYIQTVTFKYTGGPITATIGAGGTVGGLGQHGGGGLVALRLLP